MGRLVLLSAPLLVALWACGPVEYINQVGNKAASAVSAAKLAQRTATPRTSTPPPRSTCTRRAKRPATRSTKTPSSTGARPRSWPTGPAPSPSIGWRRSRRSRPPTSPRARTKSRPCPAPIAAAASAGRDHPGHRVMRQACVVRFVLLAALGVAGCAGTQLESNVHEVRSIAKEARDNGAYKCAPRELALAETQRRVCPARAGSGRLLPRPRSHAGRRPQRARGVSPVAARQVHRAARPGRPRRRRHPRQRSTSVRTSRRTRTASRTPTAARTPTTTTTASPTRPTSARTSRRTRTGSRTPTAAPIPTTTPTASPTRPTSARTQPEDKDGFEDADGCPDPDNDKDGVLDAADKCPNEPGPPDNDGCPKKFEHIVVTQEKIELKQKIFFDTNKVDHPAAQLLAARGDRQRAQVARDHDGPDRRSHRLAGNPRTQYAALGRPCRVGAATSSGAGSRHASRMEAKGFGPDQPIETNKTAAGREKNRRVEFFITQQ